MTIKTPAFDFAPIEATDLGSDEMFQAINNTTHRFFQHVILWGLEQFEVGRLNGQHEKQYLEQPKLEAVCFAMLKDESEDLHRLMIEINPDTNKYFGDQLFGEALRDLLDAEAITYDPETRGVATLVPVN